MLESVDIKVVNLIARAGSIQAAASEMGLTQPALTRRLKTLEEKLGFEIFQRMPRGVKLTRIGELLAEEGSALLVHAQHLEENLERFRIGEEGSLRVGVRPCIQSIFFRRSLLRFSASYPNIRLRVDTREAAVLCDAIRSGALDFAIIAQGYEDEFGADPVLHHALQFEPLFKMPVSVVVRSGHPTTAKDGVSTDILKYPLACEVPPASLHRRLTGIAQDLSIEFDGPRLLVDDYDFILRLVERSDFWTSVFSENETELAKRNAFEFFRNDELLPPLTVGICSRKSWESTLPAKNLVASLKENAKEYLIDG
ncbi:MAG: LysR family transcriptional regulator [Pseudomonadota bacterium]